jgi:hypothetical protein
MKRYLFTLWENMAQSISARISICYYSSTRRKSPMSFESVIVKVGSSVVQISNVPTVDVHRTLRRTLTAWLLLPLFIDHAARLNRSRASLGFFEKGETFDEGEDIYAQIETKIDSVINGREYNFNGIVVNSTAPLSYIRSLLPRFSGARSDDPVAIYRVISAVGTAPKRIARFGIIDYDSDSILSIVRAYYKYITLNHILTDDDKIVLHNARCLTRFVNSSSDVDVEYFINKLYRLFLYVAKFLRNWHLPGIGDDLYPYAARINFIIKTGIEYEKKADYVRMCDALRIQETCEFPLLRYFYLPASGCERSIVKEEKDGTFSDYTIRDVMAGIKPTVLHFDDPRKLLLSPALSCLVGPSFEASQPANYNDLCDDLQRCLDSRASKYCRDMIKHKKLNDANNIFNRMV